MSPDPSVKTPGGSQRDNPDSGKPLRRRRFAAFHAAAVTATIFAATAFYTGRTCTESGGNGHSEAPPAASRPEEEPQPEPYILILSSPSSSGAERMRAYGALEDMLWMMPPSLDACCDDYGGTIIGTAQWMLGRDDNDASARNLLLSAMEHPNTRISYDAAAALATCGAANERTVEILANGFLRNSNASALVNAARNQPELMGPVSSVLRQSLWANPYVGTNGAIALYDMRQRDSEVLAALRYGAEQLGNGLAARRLCIEGLADDRLIRMVLEDYSYRCGDDDASCGYFMPNFKALGTIARANPQYLPEIRSALEAFVAEPRWSESAREGARALLESLARPAS